MDLQIGEVREANPAIDDEQGPRACLAPVPHVGAVLAELQAGKRRLPEAIRLLDGLMEHISTGHNVDQRATYDRVGEKVPPTTLNLYSCECSAGLVAAAIAAGFFCFASECCLPGRTLEQRGLLNLEVSGDGVDIAGDRLVLAVGSGEYCRTGTKSRKTVLRPEDKPRDGAFHYALKANSDFKGIWERLVVAHGVDWLGFEHIKRAFFALYDHCPVPWDPQAGPLTPRLVSLELWDTDANAIASVEIGCIVGSAYTCLTLHNDETKYPRCGHVRTQAVLSWLTKAGVHLVDVGTTAHYYQKVYGFRAKPRAEFWRVWRRARTKPLRDPQLLQKEQHNVFDLLAPHQSPRVPNEKKPAAKKQGKFVARVEPIQADVPPADLQACFEDCGEVVSAYVIGKGGFGMVRFKEASGLDCALSKSGKSLTLAGDVVTLTITSTQSNKATKRKASQSDATAKRSKPRLS